MFFRIRGITVDNEENIYVIDWGNYRIQKFDKNGSYIQSFGRWGQGPGEFQHTMRFDIDELSGNLHIRDGGRLIKIFDKQGKYTDQILVEKFVREFNLDGKGNYLAIVSTMTAIERSKTFCFTPFCHIFSYFQSILEHICNMDFTRYISRAK